VAQKPSRILPFSLVPSSQRQAGEQESAKGNEKRRQEPGEEGEKNCLDLLGWVRDVALARQKYTHQIMIYFL
jgi:hypothetical protein